MKNLAVIALALALSACATDNGVDLNDLLDEKPVQPQTIGNMVVSVKTFFTIDGVECEVEASQVAPGLIRVKSIQTDHPTCETIPNQLVSSVQ